MHSAHLPHIKVTVPRPLNTYYCPLPHPSFFLTAVSGWAKNLFSANIIICNLSAILDKEVQRGLYGQFYEKRRKKNCSKYAMSANRHRKILYRGNGDDAPAIP